MKYQIHEVLLFLLNKRLYSTSKRKKVEEYLERQASDQYSRQAKEHSYRARSAFKLLQINEKFQFIRPGLIAIDVGAAPGSWCQVLSEIIFPKPTVFHNIKCSKNDLTKVGKGYILGVDLLPIAPIQNVDLLCKANIASPRTQAEIRMRLAGRRVNLVLSDMAPNPTGDPFTDHLRIIKLCNELLKFATSCDPEETPILADRGIFLCKIFDGPTREEFLIQLKDQFKMVKIVKPDASRDASSEIYLLASDFCFYKDERKLRHEKTRT